jgi:hypothetical protein
MTRESFVMTAAATSPRKKPLRWGLADILKEFGHEVKSPDTLKKKLHAAGEVAGQDRKFSTQQVCAAIFNEATRERTRGTAERATNWSLKNKRLRGETLPKDAVITGLEQVFAMISGLVEASSMSSAEKSDLVDAISTWRRTCDAVADRASRQLGTAGNGTNGANGHEEEDPDD